MYNEKHDKFYVGSTYSLKKRTTEHKTGKGNYTSRYDGTWLFVYYEKFSTRGEATKREKKLKQLKSKVYLKEFIKKKRASSVDLSPDLSRDLHREGRGFESLGVHKNYLNQTPPRSHARRLDGKNRQPTPIQTAPDLWRTGAVSFLQNDEVVS